MILYLYIYHTLWQRAFVFYLAIYRSLDWIDKIKVLEHQP